MTSSDAVSGADRRAVPPPLAVAVALTFVEAFALLAQGVSLTATIDEQRVALGVTSIAFFLLYGGALAWCAWNLRRLRSWARAPVVLAQLIQILTGTSFWGGDTRYVAVAFILVGIVVLAGIFHPDSIRALAEDGADRTD